ncbi:MAG: hypothetical protein E7505_00865 [Ruminococcus sp.]|nr:hypothetical protein [Ruminococcus sp.]
MSRINLAYSYDPDRERNQMLREASYAKRENITIKRKNINRGSIIKIILLAVAALVLLFCVVYGKVQVSDMYNRINIQKAELSAAESENARLKAKVESHTSLKNIEEYAENIGLQKLDKAQIWYVDIQSEDVVHIPEEEENIFIRLKKRISLFADKFSGE